MRLEFWDGVDVTFDAYYNLTSLPEVVFDHVKQKPMKWWCGEAQGFGNLLGKKSHEEASKNRTRKEKHVEVLETYLEPHGHPFLNCCFNWMTPNLFMGNGLFQKKHPFKNWLFKVLDTRKHVWLLFKPRDQGLTV